jgi:hypothetical protein
MPTLWQGSCSEEIGNMSELSKIYKNRYDELKQQREDWEGDWEDIRDFILPRTGKFEDDEDPTKNQTNRYEKIIDATATRAIRVTAAGMHGGVTSPARPWFKLGLYDQNLMKNTAIAEWVDEVQERMYTAFARSNFYNSVHKIYKEEIGYGQCVTIMDEDPEKIFRFTVLTCGEYALAEDENGKVDTLYRIMWLQARQMKMRGWSLPHNVSKELDGEQGSNPFKYFKVLHCIQPRKNYDPNKKDAQNFPIESRYILMDGDEHDILFTSGYREQSLMAPRWETNTNSPYGRSPGHDVLPDVKMLQEETADYLSALQKTVDPPLKGSGNLKYDVGHMAGSITYAPDVAQADALKPIYEVQLNIRDVKEAINDTRMQIRDGLYNDLFLMIIDAKPGMTATEVAERHEEKLLMLGPVIERQFHELLDPIIDRAFAIMARKGLLPPPPQELIDLLPEGQQIVSLSVEYISMLAQAQKLVTTQSIRATSDYIFASSQFKPEGLDKLNIDRAIDAYQEATGAPASMINSDDEVQMIRKLRAAAQARQQQLEQEAAGLEAAKTMGETKTEEGTALGDLKKTLEVG